jgi:DNA-binding response OmpR family regulator
MNADPKSVLVVDADCEMLKTLAASLSPVRFRIATCPRWDVALEYVAEHAPDFVLADAKTFYVEGSALVQRIRAASAKTRVLFLDTEDTWALFMEPAGADGAVTVINPCRRRELVQGATEAVDTTPPPSRSAEETWV